MLHMFEFKHEKIMKCNVQICTCMCFLLPAHVACKDNQALDAATGGVILIATPGAKKVAAVGAYLCMQECSFDCKK